MITNTELEAWFAADSIHWAELRKALDNPYLQRALSIVSDMGTPTSHLPPDGVPFMEFNALLNASREGYAQAIRNLMALAEPPPKQKKKLGEKILQPWQHYFEKPATVKPE